MSNFRPIDFLEPAVPDATGVHHNIDNLLMKSDYINQFYKDAPESAYGKPYEYISSYLPSEFYSGSNKATSIPLNMLHYADIIRDANVAKALSPAASEFYKGQRYRDPESSFDFSANTSDMASKTWQWKILEKMKRGDRPHGLVAYYEPENPQEDMAGEYIKSHQRWPAGIGRTMESLESTDPDTIKIYGSKQFKSYGPNEISKHIALSGLGDALDEDIDTYTEGEYGTVLHESLHGAISHHLNPRTKKVALPGYRDMFLSQRAFRHYVRNMADELVGKFGRNFAKHNIEELLKARKNRTLHDIFNPPAYAPDP
jgi:hypothetical protein